MKIGVTGQSGFIGSSVAKALSLNGHNVVSLDSYTRSLKDDRLAVKGCTNDLDWVLHFGARTSIKKSFEDPFSTYSNNLESTIIALKIACLSEAAFLFMSSYVYGKPQYLPIDEKHPLVPTNPYMGSKIIGEDICRYLSDAQKTPLVILRPSNIYGKNQIQGRLISDSVDSVRNGKPIILNDPKPKRDYLYIKDFELLILKIISQEPVKTGIFNVGYGYSYSNKDVVEIIRKLSNNKCSLIIKSNPRQNDIVDYTFDVSLLKSTFEWIPTYSLDKGLGELVANE